MKEIWKDIPGYEGLYSVSNIGNVKSIDRYVNQGSRVIHIKEKILSGPMNNKGYRTCSLYINGSRVAFFVHQLVAMAFLGHKKDSPFVVDHIDNDRSNNSVENLQIITNRQNCSKDKKNKTSKYTGVCWNKHANKWMATLKVNNKPKHVGYFNCETSAHLAYLKAVKEALC